MPSTKTQTSTISDRAAALNAAIDGMVSYIEGTIDRPLDTWSVMEKWCKQICDAASRLGIGPCLVDDDEEPHIVFLSDEIVRSWTTHERVSAQFWPRAKAQIVVRYVRKQNELGNVLIHRRSGGQRLYQAAQIFQESWASYVGDLPRALDFCGLTEYRYLSRNETANLLKVTPVTLSRWKQAGEFQPVVERPTIFPRNPPHELYYDPVAVMTRASSRSA